MANLVAATVTAFVISFLILPVVIKYSLSKNLVDIPGRRKIHKKITPSLGGVAIFLGFFLAVIMWLDFPDLAKIKFLLVPLSMVFLIGVRDDLVPLRAYIKLLGQIIAACFLIFFFDIRLTGFYGLLTIHEIPLGLSYALTLATIIVITNAFNLIDGLDGLAGTISSIALLFFGVWFFLAGDLVFSILAFSMFGAILAFLIFNWDPSEIFMGDTGALVIGLTLSIMTVHFINVNSTLDSGAPYKFMASVATAACAIIIPLIDTARIIILRLSKGQSPLKPDKSHIHHAIMRLGMSHGQSTMILATVHLVYIGLAIAAHKLGENWVLLGLLIFSLILSVFLDRLILRRKAVKDI
ncbi:undecaprenyl/decaprenyl-phosphate alpha-N-acetylglucosaminyl 1-phosphate transferase [Chryseotalea sanaruensis]|uniref:Undecaprenyl/decaprenyl-phosphate alpha-N-acetylglucosaminyl 1-phosphate transferase n=1 Tax=Chryseotalea sanaruensis TaxID=2482724 RepID=A0A401UC43_9BACT|nr:MraY family glycosyltransferase [Chryseotalea sanaruensis]GCC52473.1 undecaprenyl/decaprenyl-phosphate alpha-N-acetylglucosaminyl 1-phosphate transferase [Chryseotalea sanaruensis]